MFPIKNRLNKRLYIAFGTLIGLIIITTQWNIWLSYQINERVKDIYTQEVKSLEDLSQIKSALYRVRDRTLRLIDANTKEEIEHHKRKIQEQIERIKQEIDSYDNTRLSSMEKRELDKFKKNLEEYLEIIKKEVYPFLTSPQKEKLEKALYKKALKEFREARESLNNLINYQIIRAKERYQHSEEILKNEIVFTELILVIIIGLSIYYSKLVTNSIINPIREISDVLSKISQQNFSSYISVNSKDELGEISHMINKNIKLLQRTFKELNRLANFDDLTDLPNRKMFTKKLEECIEDFKKKNKKFAVMFIDIDNFKKINDIHGHFVGDKVLEIVARRVKSIIRQDDMLARLGGDEFGLILCDIQDETVIKRIAEKILDSVREPIYVNNITTQASLSIGIYVSHKKDISQKEVLSYADIAMYKAKRQGKARYAFFNEEMYKELEEEIKIENELRNALRKREFKIYFQPIVDIENNEIYGAEALLRWEKDGEIIPPNKFIPKLESMGLIRDVTYWIIEEVFKIIKKENFQGIISINLSVLQLLDEYFVHFLKEMKEKYPSVPPSKIKFEITESVFAKNSKHIGYTMSLIEKEGFLFSLDDFGTGYSSLSYIKDYPIKTIKIDKSFVDNLVKDSKSQALLEGIIYLANKLGLNIVLEGVENKKTLEIISKYKGIKIQGYYFFKPMSYEDFKTLIKKLKQEE